MAPLCLCRTFLTVRCSHPNEPLHRVPIHNKPAKILEYFSPKSQDAPIIITLKTTSVAKKLMIGKNNILANSLIVLHETQLQQHRWKLSTANVERMNHCEKKNPFQNMIFI
jgi:hypothetical protein